ncbi:hypothetical protein MMC22_009370 [Lobaria immixta]|nr:hypothetical protein [Lobaria immixta]
MDKDEAACIKNCRILHQLQAFLRESNVRVQPKGNVGVCPKSVGEHLIPATVGKQSEKFQQDAEELQQNAEPVATSEFRQNADWRTLVAGKAYVRGQLTEIVEVRTAMESEQTYDKGAATPEELNGKWEVKNGIFDNGKWINKNGILKHEGLPASDDWTGAIFDFILVVVNRLTKMVHYIPVTKKITALQLAQVLIKEIIQFHDLLGSVVTDYRALFTLTF